MERKADTYHSYLLRLWQVENNGSWIWRASLEKPGSGKRIAFTSLEALLDYLRAETAPHQQEQQENNS